MTVSHTGYSCAKHGVYLHPSAVRIVFRNILQALDRPWQLLHCETGCASQHSMIVTLEFVCELHSFALMYLSGVSGTPKLARERDVKLLSVIELIKDATESLGGVASAAEWSECAWRRAQNFKLGRGGGGDGAYGNG